MFDVEYYETETNKCPVEEFMDELEPKRILYFFFVGQKAILTNGFTKKTQKTPRSEIELAKQCKADYERRQKNDEV